MTAKPLIDERSPAATAKPMPAPLQRSPGGSPVHAVDALPPARATWASMIGLHPFVAFGMIAVDMMLFTEEATTVGVALAITIPIALALSVPCVLLQRYSYGDSWGAAIGKGLMVGVLTAIPFPIGSPLTVVGAIAGFRHKKALPPPR